jgi:iron complex transport system substrate-binding protein
VFLFGLFFISCNTSDKKSTSNDKIVIVDDLNNKITLNHTPKKVVSLAPSLTEMIYELGLGEKLVGNTIYCDYPEEAKKVTKVGDLLNVDAEKVLMLKPDLVFVTIEGNTQESYKKLKDLGINVFVSNPRNFEGIKKTFRDLANIFNVKQKADSIINNWDYRINKIVKENIPDTTKFVMFIIELKPLIVAGKNTFLNEYINLAGYKNIVFDSKVNYPILNREEVLKRNPSYIIYSYEDKEIREKIIEMYPEWKKIDAVKNNGIITINPNIYFRPGVRFVNAAEELVKTLRHQKANLQYRRK